MPGTGTLVLGCLFLAGVFVVATHGVWDPLLPLGRDQDNYLYWGLRWIRNGEFPHMGPQVAPTPLNLGPLFPCLVGVGLFLSGGDLQGAWWFLVSLDLAGILVAVAILARVIDTPRALVFGAAVIAVPVLIGELRYPFWHQPYHLAFLAPFLAALVALGRTHAYRWWWLACATLSLAFQLHATTWILVVVLGIVGLQKRKEIGLGNLLAGIALLAVMSWPLLSQIGSLFNASAWAAMFGRHGDAAETFVPWWTVLEQHLELLSVQTLPGLFVLVGSPVIAMARLLPGTHRRWVGEPLTLEVPFLAWVGVGGTLLVTLIHRWHIHYDLLFVVPLALGTLVLIDSAGAFFRARGAKESTVAWALVVVAMILPVNLVLRDLPAFAGHGPRPAAAAANQGTVVSLVAQALGHEALTFEGPFGRVHGFLCNLPQGEPCSARFHIERARSEHDDTAIPGDVVVRFQNDGTPILEHRKEHLVPGKGADSLQIQGAASDDDSWLHLVVIQDHVAHSFKAPRVVAKGRVIEMSAVPLSNYHGSVTVFSSSKPLRGLSGRLNIDISEGGRLWDAFLVSVPLDGVAMGFGSSEVVSP